MTGLRGIIGKPWAVPCDPPNSFDCWELVRHVRALNGLVTPSVVDRGQRRPSSRKHIERPPAGWQRLDAVEPLCVVRMGISHVGVALDRFDVIHSRFGMGVGIDRLSTLGDVTFWRWQHAGND